MEEKINRLLEDYLNNRSSDEEIMTLLEYFKLRDQEPLLRKLIMRELKRSEEPNIRVKGVEEHLDLAYAHVKEFIDREKVPVARKVKLWSRVVTVAASVTIVLFGLGLLYYKLNHKSEKAREFAYSNDIAPGKNRATLTVNGKLLQLSDARTAITIRDNKLIYNDGSYAGGNLSKKSVNMLAATTPRGGTYQFILQDGTKVWLNADSKLEFFPDYKNKKQRIVKLQGEGYFEVAKDKSKPFIVESPGQKVRVLGTHFNIKAYKDEVDTKTTLLQGRVDVNGKILQPNQQSTLLPTGKINIGISDVNATAWLTGKFRFVNTPLQDVMKQLARWYDIEVIYPDGIPQYNFTGGISRNLNASEALKILEIMNVKFKIEGNKIIVNK